MEICNPPLKLSQNERERILENERQKWRIFRIQQVREQSKNQAKRILQSVKEVEVKERLRIENLVREKWEAEKKKKVEELEEKCMKGMQEFGEGHRRAKLQAGEMKAHKDRRKRDDKVATERGRIASRKLDKEKADSSEKENTIRLHKEKTLQREKKRASKMAHLPTPRKFKPQCKPIVKIPKKVTFHQAGTFMTSSYIPSKLKIVKEKNIDEVNAKEYAEKETEKCQQMEEMKMKKEEENNRKIEERGKKAQKKEKTREMLSQLLKDLKEADEDHRLEEFLQGDDDVEGVKAEVLSKNLVEKIAEERAKKILKQDNIENAAIPAGSRKPLSKIEDVGPSSTVRDIKFGVQGLTYTIRDLGAADETDRDHQAMTQTLPKACKKPISIMKNTEQKGLKNIHLKATVPVHEIPVTKEKFRFRVPDETISSLTETEASTDLSSGSSETLKDVSDSILNRGSSIEELEIKVTVTPFASESSSEECVPTDRKMRETLNSEATEYLQIQKSFMEKPVNSPSSSSSGMTEYYDVPHTSSEDSDKIRKNIEGYQERGIRIRELLDKLNQPQLPRTDYQESPCSTSDESKQIRKNIKCIQEGGKQIRKLIDILKRPQIHDPPKLKPADNISAFKTPPQIYTEPLKEEDSSSRPVSKRQKADKLKKLLLEHYVPILVKARGRDLEQITASTVDGSGLTLSTQQNMSDLVKYVDISRGDSSSSPTITSDIIDISSDLDLVPSKISSSTPVSSNDSLISSGASARSGASDCLVTPISHRSSDVSAVSLGKGFEDGRCDQMMQEQIYLRLMQLQQLKQQVILAQQIALKEQKRLEECKNGSVGSQSNDMINSSAIQHSNGESTVDLSSRCEYQTPTREVSTQSWQDLSSPSCTQVVEENVDGAPHREPHHIPGSQKSPENQNESDVLPCGMMPVEREYNPAEYSCSASDSSRALPQSSLNPSSSKGEKGEDELPFHKELKIITNALEELASVMNNPLSVVSGPMENSPVSSRGESPFILAPCGTAPFPSSSSSGSIPDMSEILKKFGLPTWACSMIKKMDIAEKNSSSSDDGSVR